VNYLVTLERIDTESEWGNTPLAVTVQAESHIEAQQAATRKGWKVVSVDADNRFWVPEENLGRLADKIEKLSRRATKLGVEPVSIVATGGSSLIPAKYDEDHILVRPEIRRVEIELKGGTTPKLPGDHRLVAVLEPLTPESIMVNFVPGLDLDESRRAGIAFDARRHFIEAKGRFDCAHCRTARVRKQGFLVETEGEIKQIGRNCLADYLGARSVGEILRFAEILKLLHATFGECGEEGWGRGGDVLGAGPLDVLAMTSLVIELDGWVPKSKADEWQRAPSVETINGLLFPPRNPSESEQKMRESYLSQYGTRHSDDAMIVLEWARAIPDDQVARSDYLANLRTVASLDFVPLKGIALLASAVASMRREQERNAEKKQAETATSDSKHVGEIKERIEVEAEILGIRDIDGDFGGSRLFTFVDAEGNVLKWFCSGRIPLKADDTHFEIGSAVTVTGTVKRHSEFKGRAETQLSRCKMTERGEG
jgi:hypothetical protein